MRLSSRLITMSTASYKRVPSPVCARRMARSSFDRSLVSSDRTSILSLNETELTDWYQASGQRRTAYLLMRRTPPPAQRHLPKDENLLFAGLAHSARPDP